MTPRRLLAVVLSAALQALALPPWGWSAIAWVALVPFFLALRGVTIAQGAVIGLVWGTLAVWGVAYWVPIAVAHYYQQPWWFGLLFGLGISLAVSGIYAAAFGACASWCGDRVGPVARSFLLAAFWVTWEFARARLFSGEPWILFGYALMPEIPMIQIADLGGVYLLTFVVVLTNATIADIVALPPQDVWSGLRRVGAGAVVVVAAFSYGKARLATTWPTESTIPVTLVQGNNDIGHQWREEFYGVGLDAYLKMSLESAAAHGSELLVWPESSITFFLAREPSFRSAVRNMLKAAGADLILGGPHFEDRGETQEPLYFNSAFYLTSDGEIVSRYDKTHLLPFAEYFPLRTIEFLRRRFEQVRFFTQAESGHALETRFGAIATVICFEGIFPELVREQTAHGARLLVNLSNDAWLGPGAGPAQHLSMVTLRAVENRLWVVRATTSGISAIIDPYGRIVARGAVNAPDTLSATIAPMSVDTFYKRFGDVFAYGCVAVSVLALLVLRGVRAQAPGVAIQNPCAPC